MIIGVPVETFSEIFPSPTTIGILSDLQIKEICEVFPPESVTKPLTLLRLKRIISAGERLSDATMTPSGIHE